MGRKPTVGTTAEHSQFARDLTAYLTHVREESGLSVRRVSALTPGERGNSWWADIFNGSKILTTNDVHYISNLLGINPYEFVANARRLTKGEALPTVRFSVGRSGDDDSTLTPQQEKALRKSDVALAALRGRNEADVPHAE